MSGAIVSGEFNSPVLLEAEQEGTWYSVSLWSQLNCMRC